MSDARRPVPGYGWVIIILSLILWPFVWLGLGWMFAFSYGMCGRDCPPSGVAAIAMLGIVWFLLAVAWIALLVAAIRWRIGRRALIFAAIVDIGVATYLLYSLRLFGFA